MFTIQKAKIESWGYEIKGRNFHNTAPSVEAAIRYLKNRYGYDVQYRIIEEGRKVMITQATYNLSVSH